MNRNSLERMENILDIRGFSPQTKRSYVNQIDQLSRYFNKPPEDITKENIYTYQVYLVHEKRVGWSAFNQAVCAMRFFLTMFATGRGTSNTSPIKNAQNTYL